MCLMWMRACEVENVWYWPLLRVEPCSKTHAPLVACAPPVALVAAASLCLGKEGGHTYQHG